MWSLLCCPHRDELGHVVRHAQCNQVSHHYGVIFSDAQCNCISHQHGLNVALKDKHRFAVFHALCSFNAHFHKVGLCHEDFHGSGYEDCVRFTHSFIDVDAVFHGIGVPDTLVDVVTHCHCDGLADEDLDFDEHRSIHRLFNVVAHCHFDLLQDTVCCFNELVDAHVDGISHGVENALTDRLNVPDADTLSDAAPDNDIRHALHYRQI